MHLLQRFVIFNFCYLLAALAFVLVAIRHSWNSNNERVQLQPARMQPRICIYREFGAHLSLAESRMTNIGSRRDTELAGNAAMTTILVGGRRRRMR